MNLKGLVLTTQQDLQRQVHGRRHIHGLRRPFHPLGTLRQKERRWPEETPRQEPDAHHLRSQEEHRTLTRHGDEHKLHPKEKARKNNQNLYVSTTVIYSRRRRPRIFVSGFHFRASPLCLYPFGKELLHSSPLYLFAPFSRHPENGSFYISTFYILTLLLLSLPLTLYIFPLYYSSISVLVYLTLHACICLISGDVCIDDALPSPFYPFYIILLHLFLRFDSTSLVRNCPLRWAIVST